MVRSAIESGTPSETAASLVGEHHMTRQGAISVSAYLPPGWGQAFEVLREMPESEFDRLSLTRLDRDRISALMSNAS